MKLYLLIISCCVAMVSIILSLTYKTSFLAVLGLTTMATVLVILVDGAVAGMARMLPKRVANYRLKVYAVSKREKNFYEKLKIRNWKEKLPEIGHFTGFRKNKIADPKSLEYIDRFLLEICYGELGHFASIFFGFLILFFLYNLPIWQPICLCVAVINGLLNMPFIFILRYNSYKLLILRKSNIKKQNASNPQAEIKC